MIAWVALFCLSYHGSTPTCSDAEPYHASIILPTKQECENYFRARRMTQTPDGRWHISVRVTTTWYECDEARVSQ